STSRAPSSSTASRWYFSSPSLHGLDNMQIVTVNLLSCKWYGGHRDLHSFPTRRSSDLLVLRSGINTMNGIGHSWQTVGNKEKNRSEEHTSELQSRFDLVCRLLLEKKKKKK